MHYIYIYYILCVIRDRHPKQAVETTFVLDDLTEASLLDEGFWYMFFMLQARRSEKHTPEALYELLLVHLAGKPLSVALDDQKVSNKGYIAYRTPQRSETCYTKNLMEAFRYLLLRHGLSSSQVKQVTFAIRTQLLTACQDDLLAFTDPTRALELKQQQSEQNQQNNSNSEGSENKSEKRTQVLHELFGDKLLVQDANNPETPVLKETTTVLADTEVRNNSNNPDNLGNSDKSNNPNNPNNPDNP